MRTIETTATVTPDGMLRVRVPLDIPPGEHHVVLVIEEQAITPGKRPPLDLLTFHVDRWPADLSLRREDLYGQWGR